MLPLLIRVDFVLATLVLVGAPLILLVASVRRPGVRERMLVYWRASSLLMITVYLMIDGRPAAFIAGNAALVLIPLALWYGDVGFVEDEHIPASSAITDWFRRWHVVATLFCVVSLPLTLPTLRCVMGPGPALCQAWLAPPRELHAVLHPSLDPAVLGDTATVALLIYGAYLVLSTVRFIRAVVRN